MPSVFEPLTPMEINRLESAIMHNCVSNYYYDLWERLLNNLKDLKVKNKNLRRQVFELETEVSRLQGEIK